MAKHQFGIMRMTPEQNKRYDIYEPEKFDCISVHDDYIEPLLVDLSLVDCYWHTLEHPEKGLAYCGITLIPPSSLKPFMNLLEGCAGTEALMDLLLTAEKENRFVIHFGI